jgi:hypothetical protein
MQQRSPARELAQAADFAYVIDVRVRVHERGCPEAVSFQARYDLVHAVAAIHDDRLAGRLVADDRAIAVQSADRKRLEDHSPKSRNAPSK